MGRTMPRVMMARHDYTPTGVRSCTRWSASLTGVWAAKILKKQFARRQAGGG